MPYPRIDLTKVKTYLLPQRANRVSLENMIQPVSSDALHDHPDLIEIAERIAAARRAGPPVIWMIGGHVIKCGLAPVVIDLMERGVITHLASNGAAAIHDFEIALRGQTSEDVAKSLEDGSFGMAEETGALINRAIRSGARDGLGAGEALGRCLAEAAFEFRQYSLVYNAYRLHIPYTIHVAIGTDIIHQHPEADFAAIGWASGEDFKVYTASVSQLENGVFCNFGSAVIGPEVFLKSISIVRNLGFTVRHFTTANFDLIPLEGDYRRPIGEDTPEYYYRPRKNIVNRPVMLGGKGFHVCADHRQTIPGLHYLVTQKLAGAQLAPLSLQAPALQPENSNVIAALKQRHPSLEPVFPAIAQSFAELRRCLLSGGTLFICGNGGSMSDALHISGEMLKSYTIKRSVSERIRARLSAQPDGELLLRNLEPGLRAHVLGINPSLASAVANDMPDRDTGPAQELLTLARPGDVLLAISTSGKARNAAYAAQTARALGLAVISLTGETGGRLTALADIAIRAPGTRPDRVQEMHVLIYHALCEMLEEEFFGSPDSTLF